MKIRRLISLTAALSFVVTLLTSVVLYIVPQGRIAYWADWRLWGLTKEQWGGIHINVGVFFIIGLGIYSYYNWNPMMSYLKGKSRNFKLFTKEFNLALVITLVFVLGTYMEIPPFSSILDISSGIKDAYAQKYGEPPYGHAELSSLKTFSKKIGMDPALALSRALTASGLEVKETLTLKTIAEQNGVAPGDIYERIKTVSADQ